MIPFSAINVLLVVIALLPIAHGIDVLRDKIQLLYELREHMRILDENLDNHDRLEAERFQALEGDGPKLIHCIECKWYRGDAANVYGQCLLHDLPREDFDFCSNAKKEAGKA